MGYWYALPQMAQNNQTRFFFMTKCNQSVNCCSIKGEQCSIFVANLIRVDIRTGREIPKWRARELAQILFLVRQISVIQNCLNIYSKLSILMLVDICGVWKVSAYIQLKYNWVGITTKLIFFSPYHMMGWNSGWLEVGLVPILFRYQSSVCDLWNPMKMMTLNL